MKVVALIQARMASMRLPGKVLMELAGKPMLLHIASRLQYGRLIDKVVVATSINKKDDAIEEFCRMHKIDFYRGSENDISERLYRASMTYQADVAVRVWGDCPLIDPFLIDEGIDNFMKSKADYLSNFFPKKSYPRGFEFEIYSISTLENIVSNIKDDFFREFPFEFVWKNRHKFSIVSLKNEVDLSDFANFTVDYPQDAEAVSEILKHFALQKHIFGFREVVKYCQENKWIVDKNKGLERNIEYKRKLKKDRHKNAIRR